MTAKRKRAAEADVDGQKRRPRVRKEQLKDLDLPKEAGDQLRAGTAKCHDTSDAFGAR
jgi:hypothetical protein